MKRTIILLYTAVFSVITASFTFAGGLVEVGYKTGVNGYNQIFIVKDGKEEFITVTEYSNTDPQSDRKFVTWIGHTSIKTQVFFTYNNNEKHIPLSGELNAANPRIDQGKVVWEEYVAGEGWQVFLFDGIRKVQLTSGDESRNPYVEGDYVVIGRKAPESDWYAELYNITTKELATVAEGIAAKAPIIVEGQIVLTGRGYSEPTGEYVRDVLPAGERVANKQVTFNDIRQELGIIPQ